MRIRLKRERCPTGVAQLRDSPHEQAARPLGHLIVAFPIDLLHILWKLGGHRVRAHHPQAWKHGGPERGVSCLEFVPGEFPILQGVDPLGGTALVGDDRRGSPERHLAKHLREEAMEQASVVRGLATLEGIVSPRHNPQDGLAIGDPVRRTRGGVRQRDPEAPLRTTAASGTACPSTTVPPRRFLFFWITQTAAGAKPDGWGSSAADTPSIRRHSLTRIAYLLSASLRCISSAFGPSPRRLIGTRNG